LAPFDDSTQLLSRILIIEPVHLELNSDTSLSYASTAKTEFDVPLLDTIDRFNFSHIDSSTHLTWVNRGGLDNFIVSDCKQQSMHKDWIKIEDGKIFPATNTIFYDYD